MQYLEEFEIRPESTGQDAAIWQVAWTQHGVVAARASGTVDVIDMKSMLVKTSIKNEHKLGVVALTRSSNDELLLTSSMDGVVTLWQWCDAQLTKVAQRASLRGETFDNNAVFQIDVWTSALHPQSMLFAAGGESGNVALFSAEADSFGKGIRHLVHDAPESDFCLSLAFVRLCILTDFLSEL